MKIQLFGRRKTFSLLSHNRTKAAAEACRIFHTISAQGWDAVVERWGPTVITTHLSDSGAGLNGGYWKGRLTQRRYPQRIDSARLELSARLEHSGVSRYFPLGSNDETKASATAARIYRVISEQGWGVANQKFRRELTLAFRWLDDPLAWTYTTFHTCRSGEPMPLLKSGGQGSRSVAIIEPDAGIRWALAECISCQEQFAVGAMLATATEALREIPRQSIHLVLVNAALPDQSGSACLQLMQQIRPSIVGLPYSVFEDSDQLFKSTPGGAAGYMLKRTSPHALLEPLAETAGPLSRELVAKCIREYFQRVVAAMPFGTSALEIARLTAREHEILGLLAQGALAKEIANSLGISIWTVHGHVKRIFEKLNVHTRIEAVVKFLHK